MCLKLPTSKVVDYAAYKALSGWFDSQSGDSPKTPISSLNRVGTGPELPVSGGDQWGASMPIMDGLSLYKIITL